jgi:hypothetical protein
VAVLSTVLDALPRIIAAAIVLALAFFIGRWVAGLLEEVLPSLGFDSSLQALGIGAAPEEAPRQTRASGIAPPAAPAPKPAPPPRVKGPLVPAKTPTAPAANPPPAPPKPAAAAPKPAAAITTPSVPAGHDFLALPAAEYVIELAHADSPAGLGAAPHPAHGEVYELLLSQNGSESWLLLWGPFADLPSARAARDELAAQGATPGWPRRIGPLQTEARRSQP